MNIPESIAEEIVVDNVGYHIIQTSRDKLKGDITAALKARDEERDGALQVLNDVWQAETKALRTRAEQAERLAEQAANEEYECPQCSGILKDFPEVAEMAGGNTGPSFGPPATGVSESSLGPDFRGVGTKALSRALKRATKAEASLADARQARDTSSELLLAARLNLSKAESDLAEAVEALMECEGWMRCECRHPACKRCRASNEALAIVAQHAKK